MPVMDGLELSKQTRALSPFTKIILFSGFNDFEYAKSAITIGVEDYLLKPIVPDDFVNTIHKVISSIVEEKNKSNNTPSLDTKLTKSHLFLAFY